MTHRPSSQPEYSGEPAGDLWRHTLARIATLFGRLVYLSSLRRAQDGGYVHPGLARMVGDEQAGDTLRRSHARVFQDWLALSLEQQKSDLEEYLEQLPDTAAVLQEWSNPQACAALAPQLATEPERMLFLSDLEKLLAILRREHAVHPPDPRA